MEGGLLKHASLLESINPFKVTPNSYWEIIKLGLTPRAASLVVPIARYSSPLNFASSIFDGRYGHAGSIRYSHEMLRDFFKTISVLFK